MQAAPRLGRQEALDVLGLDEGASDADVQEAWVRLMRVVHPDGGGSDWLAARVNQAPGRAAADGKGAGYRGFVTSTARHSALPSLRGPDLGPWQSRDTKRTSRASAPTPRKRQRRKG